MIAEAMDTAQRGMGLNWAGAKELIRRSLLESRTVKGADLACGAGTDQLAQNSTIPEQRWTLSPLVSFMGPFETIDLNAPGGVRDYADRYQGIYSGVFRSSQWRVDWSGPVMDIVESERRKRTVAWLNRTRSSSPAL
jgi:hypothetical protein